MDRSGRTNDAISFYELLTDNLEKLLIFSLGTVILASFLAGMFKSIYIGLGILKYGVAAWVACEILTLGFFLSWYSFISHRNKQPKRSIKYMLKYACKYICQL